MRVHIKLAFIVAAIVPLVVLAQRPVVQQLEPTDPLQVPGTFSVLGYDPATDEIGAAVQSKVFSVGNGVIWAEAGVGAVATQAVVDVSYGPQGIALLKQGMAPKDIIKKIWDADTDPGYRGQRWEKTGRQFAVINAKGEVAAYTGPTAPTDAGDSQGKFCTAQGNTLGRKGIVGRPDPPDRKSAVPVAMCDAFEKSAVDATGRPVHISLRLVAALEAGHAAGGDHRGMQSAALLVVKKDAGVWLHNDVVQRLQVDDNPEPIAELRRLVEKSPASRPRRGGGAGGR